MKLFRLFLAILFLCHFTGHAQQVTISASQTAASCAADGKIQVTVTNVPTTVYYAIEKTAANLKGIQTSNTNNGLFTDLEPGDYYYGYFDGNTFIKAPQTITVISTNSGISPTIVSLTASRFTYCGNGADPGGEVVVTMRGGTWPYVVSLLKTSDGSVVQTKANSSYYNFTNVPAGTYTARAVDKCGVTFTTGQTITVTANTAFTASNISVPSFLNNSKVDLVYNTPGDWCSGIKKASIDVAQAFGYFDVVASPRYIGVNEDFVYKLEIQNATGGWTVYDNLKYNTDLTNTDRFELPTDRSKWGLARLTGTICGLSKTVSLDFSTSSVGITLALTKGDIIFSDDPAYITNCPFTGKILVKTSASGGCSPYSLEVTSNVTGVKKTYTSTVGSSEISYLQDIDDKSYSFKLMDKSGAEVPTYSFRNTTTNPNALRFNNVGKSVVFESGYFTPGTVDFRSQVRFYRGASGENFNKSELVVDIPVPSNSTIGLIGPVTFSLESGPSVLTVVPLRMNILQIPNRFGLGNDLTPGNYKIRIKDSGCFNEVFDVVLDSYFTKIELTSVSSSPSPTVCDRHVKIAKVTVSGTANAESTTFYENRIIVGIVSGPSIGFANFDFKNNSYPWTSSYLRVGTFDFVFGAQPAGTYEIGIAKDNKVSPSFFSNDDLWPGTTTASVISRSIFPFFDMNNSGGAICSGNTTGTLSVKVDNVDSAAMYFLKKDTDVTYPATGQTSSVFTGLSTGRYWVKVKSTCFELEEKFDINLSSSGLISGSTTYCVGENLSLNISDIGPVSSIKWTLPDGTFLNTNLIQINNVAAVNSGLYRVEVTTLHGCTFTDTANITVAASQTPTGAVAQVFCKGSNPTVAILSVNESGVVWYDTAGAVDALEDTTALVNGKTYYGTFRSGGCGLAAFLAVTVTINDPQTPTGNATQEFCKVDNKKVSDLVTTESGVTWYDTATAGNVIASTTVLENNKVYYGSLKVGTCESPTRFAVTVTLSDPQTPTGATTQEFCKANNATIADLVTTETGVIWYDAATAGNVITSATALENNNIYYGSLKTGTCESPTRLAVTVTLSDPQTPTGATAQEFCKVNNATVADLVTTETGGIWYDAATGGNVITSTTALENNKVYYGSSKVGTCETATRFAVTVTLSDPQTPTGTATQEFCKVNNATVADLVTTEIGVIWYDAATAGNVITSTIALENNKVYYGSLKTGTCESPTRLAVTVTLIDPQTPTGTATQEFCKIDNKKVADLVTTESGVTWYDAATAGNVITSTTALENSKIYYGSLKAGTCESPTRFAVTITLSDPQTPTGTATQEFCKANNATVADLVTTETGVIWYDAATGGNVIISTTALENNKVYYGSLKTGTCESPTRLAVTVTLSDPQTPTGNATQEFCKVNNATVADLVTTETGVIWYDAATAGNVITSTTALESNNIYYGSLKIGTCESPTRLAVTVTLIDPQTPTGTATQEFCKIDNKKVTDLVTTESGVTWYDAATAGNVITSTTALESNNIYYGSLKTGTCESPTRLAVTVTLSDPKTPTTANTTQEFCKVDNKKVSDLVTTESGVTWYDAAIGGNVITSTTALENNKIYYGSLKAGTCESPTRLAVTVTLSDPQTPTTTKTTQEFCKVDNKKVADLAVNESGVTWYDAATGGNAVASTTILENNKVYYGSLKAGTCESPTRLEVTVTLGDPQTPTTSKTIQEFCKTDNKIVADLAVNESGVTWYDAATAGNAVASTTTLENSKVYYGSLKAGTCESPTRLAVTVTLSDPQTPTTSKTKQDFCKTDNKKVSDLATTESGVTWYDTATGGNAIASTVILENNKVYYGSLKAGICESPTRLAVTVTLSDPQTPTGTATQEFCKTDNKTVADLAVNESGVTWYYTATGGNAIASTVILENNKVYYGSLKVGTCEGPTRLAVTVTLSDPQTPTGAATQEFCKANNATVADLVTTETGVIWYDAAIAGNVIASTTVLENNKMYYGSLKVGICENITRFAVKVIVKSDLAESAPNWNSTACISEKRTYSMSSGMSDYNWLVSKEGTIVAGGHSTDNYITVEWNREGKAIIKADYIDVSKCDPLVSVDFLVTINSCSQTVIPENTSSDIGLKKTVDNATPDVGQQVFFTITAENLGANEVKDIIISEKLPSGYEYITSKVSSGNYNASNGTWTLPILQMQEYQTLTITAKVKGSGDYLNIAYLKASDPLDSNEANNRAEASVTTQGVIVYNAISRDGDGLNDYFKIDGLDKYPNNTVEIFNRGGVQIFNTSKYGSNDNVFRGISEGRFTIDKQRGVPTGTYFYILRYEAHGTMNEKSGYLYVKN